MMLLDSHNKDDIDILCDEVYEMENGHMERIRQEISEDVVQPAGSVGDHFLLFPLSFYTDPINVTTKENLEQTGIDVKVADTSAKR